MSSAHLHPQPPPPLRTYLRAGFISGLVAAALASLVSLTLQAITGDHYSQLGVAPVAVAALLTSVAGGGVYWLLVRRTTRPVAYFAALALVLATLDTQLTIVTRHEAVFAAIAAPLHFIVAVVAVQAIPSIVAGRPSLAWKRQTMC
jgi:hypothetical protein